MRGPFFVHSILPCIGALTAGTRPKAQNNLATP